MTQWPPMISILFLIMGTFQNQFKCNYLKKIFLPSVLLHFWNLHQILNFLKKRWASQLMLFLNYILRDRWSEKTVPKSALEHPSTVNIFKGPKETQNLQNRVYIIFPISLKEIKLENVSLSDIWNFRTVC